MAQFPEGKCLRARRDKVSWNHAYLSAFGIPFAASENDNNLTIPQNGACFIVLVLVSIVLIVFHGLDPIPARPTGDLSEGFVLHYDWCEMPLGCRRGPL